MSLCIIDYGAGNLHSAAKAFARAAEPLGIDVRVTTDASELATASHIVLPGVGAFADCMAGLKAATGMIGAMEKAVHGRGVPFFGICVGMQMLATHGFEHGQHAGLGWIDGTVEAIKGGHAQEQTLRIPHMGWNTLSILAPAHPLFRGFGADEHAYFVHSYHFVCANPDDCLATTDYGTALSACIGRGTMVGTQFHPEKSQQLGLRLMANFLKPEAL